MPHCKLDHLVVAATDLDTGSEYVADLLGVRVEPGGRHDSNATHNRLLRLGADQYLEIIAIDPDAEPPPRPRWFALDDPAMRAAIAGSPGLITWVVRSTDLDAAAARAPYRDMTIRELERGDLRWRMTFTDDGALPGDGVLPLLIEWQGEAMPPPRLPDAGCALTGFVVQAPASNPCHELIGALGLEGVELQRAARPRLCATISTPQRGAVSLASLQPAPA